MEIGPNLKESLKKDVQGIHASGNKKEFTMSKKHKRRNFERPVQTQEEEQEAIDRLFAAIKTEEPISTPSVYEGLISGLSVILGQESSQEAESVREVTIELEEPKSPRKVKTASTVNFRIHPSKESTIIFPAQKGTEFELLEYGDEWSHLKFVNGKTVAFGWIMSQYLIEEN
jgi:hypothetical protein